MVALYSPLRAGSWRQTRLAALAGGLLLSACAAAPAAGPPAPLMIVEAEVPPERSFEDAVEATLAGHRGGAPRDLAVTVDQITETAAQQVYEVSLRAGRSGQTYTVYASCAPERLEDCVRKVADAAKALGKMGR